MKIQAALDPLPSFVKAAPRVLYVPDAPTVKQPVGAVVRAARASMARYSRPAGAADVRVRKRVVRRAMERGKGLRTVGTRDCIVADTESCAFE